MADVVREIERTMRARRGGLVSAFALLQQGGRVPDDGSIDLLNSQGGFDTVTNNGEAGGVRIGSRDVVGFLRGVLTNK